MSWTTERAEYVLSPLLFQAKLRQSDLDHCVDFPKYLVHSKLSLLSILLSRAQLPSVPKLDTLTGTGLHKT